MTGLNKLLLSDLVGMLLLVCLQNHLLNFLLLAVFFTNFLTILVRVSCSDFKSLACKTCSYRVTDPSCHPQISLCARIQKKTESWSGHPLKWLSPGLATPKKWQSPELATPKLTRVGDSAIFLGWQVLDLVISEGGQFRTLFFFWILAHREILGWQEGTDTL